MYVIKKTGKKPYEKNKIKNAIIQAFNSYTLPDFSEINGIVNEIDEQIESYKDEIKVEDIENIVMSILYKKAPKAARAYSSYKMDKERASKNPTPTEKVLYVDPEIEHENGNKNPHLVHIKNAYLAEIPSKEMMFKLLPDECVDAHNRGVVYFHDSAYSAREMVNVFSHLI